MNYLKNRAEYKKLIEIILLYDINIKNTYEKYRS